jgi:maltose alpha-D-glucosyltransferase / alpha-amylase
LADHRGVPAFMPEPHDRLYQRSLQQSLRNHVQRTLTSLERNLKRVPEQCVDLTRAVVGARDELLGRITAAARMPLSGQRIRIHGDLHLGQVLWTGRDVTFIDLEGQTLESIGERRLKRSPLRDVAYMLRSLDYATGVARERLNERGLPLEQLASALIGAQRQWYATNGAALLQAYLTEVEGSSFAYPLDEVVLLLDTFCLDKALHEVTFELRNRPEWMHIPLRSVIELTDLAHA